MIDFQDDSQKIMDYIQRHIHDNHQLFKTIGYYLKDDQAVKEVKNYFNRRYTNNCMILMIIIDLFIFISAIVWIKMSYLTIIIKILSLILLLFIGHRINKILKNFLKKSCQYRFLYTLLQKVPREQLEKIYHQVKNG